MPTSTGSEEMGRDRAIAASRPITQLRGPLCLAWVCTVRGPGLSPLLGHRQEAEGVRALVAVLTPDPREVRPQLTLRAGCPPPRAPPGLLGVGADGVVPPRGVQHSPCPLLRAPPEATELLLLGARPPQRPLAHFTLRWQEGREARGQGGHVSSPGPGYPRGAPPICSQPQPQSRGVFSPEGRRVLRGSSEGGGDALSLHRAQPTLALARPPQPAPPPGS